MPPVSQISSSTLDGLSEHLRPCIERLAAYQPEHYDISSYNRSRLAAVLVLLFEDAGVLRVLLTTRSKTLRAHPGQTALPGGKVEDIDVDYAHTALREAHEEVGLPINCPSVHTICQLEPFISAHKLVVTPLVALLTDAAVLKMFKAAEKEVACIFNHPLEAILDPSLVASEPLATKGSEDWPYETDLYYTTIHQIPSLNNVVYRMHRFRSSASPVTGLTADILIKVAEIAYGRTTSFERWVEDQVLDFPAMRTMMDLASQKATASNGSGTTA